MATSVSLPAGIPASHRAVATVAARAPLAIIERPTEAPGPGEVLVHVEWTSSSPLELHQADGGLLVKHPYVMGGAFAGIIVSLGPAGGPPRASDEELHLGDAVFGFAFRSPREKGYQEYLTTDAFLVSKLPPNLTLQEAVTVPTNLVTTFHAITTDLQLELPWPIPQGWKPEVAKAPILVWGAGSSVGLYTIQILAHWGYENIMAVASGGHFEYLRTLGAASCFNYREADVVDRIWDHVSQGAIGPSEGPKVPFILDCIGSRERTLRPLSKIAERGTKVAIMLPIINVHASEEEPPEYEMDVSKVLVGEWKEGVELRGTRTHHYLQNEFFKEHLQSEIIPTLLKEGIVKPNKQRIVEAKILLERAEGALALLRSQAPSGEKLVWRVAREAL